MENKEKKIIGKIFNVLSVCMLLGAIVLLCFVVVSKGLGKTPQIFGYSFHFVVSESMEDEINVGDLVIGKKADISDVKVGDDILFVSADPKDNGKIIVHRVDEVKIVDGKCEVYTYGVNKKTNPVRDRYPTTEIIGKVEYVSGFWGKIFNPVNAVFLLLAVGIIAIFYFGAKSFIKTFVDMQKEKAALEKETRLREEIMKEEIMKEERLKLESNSEDSDGKDENNSEK